MSEHGDAMVDRILRVLEVFDMSTPTLTASEIARRANLPVPTAHRIVGDLVRTGILERGPGKEIRIGIRLWEIATRSSNMISLREIALPYMEDLQSVVKHHTQLSVLDRGDVLSLEKLSSRFTRAANLAMPGIRLPLLACAPGLVLLAFSPSTTSSQLISSSKITQFTDSTPSSREAIEQLVAHARQAGYALSSGWMHSRSTGLAVPILNEDGLALAALSVVTPLGVAERLDILPALKTTALSISRAIASRGQVDPRLRLLGNQIRKATAVSSGLSAI